MNLLNQKLEEKFKLLEEYDKMYTNDQANYLSLDLSNLKVRNSNLKNKNISSSKKSEEIKIDNSNKFESIYSNFDFDKKDSICYFRNFVDLMDYMYILNQNKNFKSNIDKQPKKQKNIHNINNKRKKSNESSDKSNNKNKDNNNQKYEICFLPKRDYIIDRLLRYGINLEKKKIILKEQNEQTFKNMANLNISKKNKSISLDPDKITERLFYNKYSKDELKNNKILFNKKNKKEKDINNNFTFRPSINAKSKEIANKLGPSTERLLKKKKHIDKKEIKKIAINYYKNLFLNNSYNNRHNKKNININIKELINKLYNGGLEDLKKKELKYQENALKKSEEFKNYPFQPNADKNNIKSMSLKKLNNNMYNKQFEWKSKKDSENSKKKEIQENTYFEQICTFKPDISPLLIKDDEKIIKRNIKSINNYVERRRKQIKNNQEKINKSFNGSIKYGLSLKDLYFDPNQNLNNERTYKKKCPYINLKKNNKKINTFRCYNRNSMDCIIPPYTNRIYCYKNESGDLNNSLKKNNFSNVDYSKFDFIDAINALHNEIDNLNI